MSTQVAKLKIAESGKKTLAHQREFSMTEFVGILSLHVAVRMKYACDAVTLLLAWQSLW